MNISGNEDAPNGNTDPGSESLERGNCVPPDPAQSQSAAASEAESTGMFDVFEMTDESVTVFMTLLRYDPLSLAEVCAVPEFGEISDMEDILAALVRTGKIEIVHEHGEDRYSAVTGRRTTRQVSSDLWEALEG